MAQDPFDLLDGPPAQVAPSSWFHRLGESLLSDFQLMIGGQPHRLREIEVYHKGPEHDDPFAHDHPIQRQQRRWYFHRAGQSYRGGSFKGVDITFGPEGVGAGVLIRTIEGADGRVTCGPSVCVDRMLALTGHGAVADLDGQIGGRRVDDPTSPVHLRHDPGGDRRQVYTTARVGLSLKRVDEHPTMPEFIALLHRFVTDPGTVSKGKLHGAVALFAQGRDLPEVRAVTRSPLRTLEQWHAAWLRGRDEADLAPFMGTGPSGAELARLLGAAQAIYGQW